MAWRPLTIVSIKKADIDAVSASGLTPRELAARANAKIPGTRYWLAVLALWMSVSVGATALNPRGLQWAVPVPPFLFTTVGRLFAVVWLIGLPTGVYVCITRWNSPFVYAARRELGEPVCGSCGYATAAELCSECGAKLTAR